MKPNKLCNIVKIEENNMDCVVLKVRKNAASKLIALGCFDGTETMFRLTKGGQHTCTVWRGTESFNWDWGDRGFTLVSDNMHKMGHLIQECIETDFEIYIGSDEYLRRQTLYTKKPAHMSHTYEMMWFGNVNACETTYCSTHRDGDFFRQFKEPELRALFAEKGYNIVSENLTTSPNTGCWIKTFVVQK